MEKVNIYIYNLSPTSLNIAKQIRDWKSPKIHLWISTTELQKADKNIKNIILNWKDSKNIEQITTINHSISYYEWNLQKYQIEQIFSNGLKALIQLGREEQQFIVLNDESKCKKHMTCFVDARQCPELPDTWIKFPYFTTYDDIHDYCKQHGVFDFDPANSPKLYRRKNEKNQNKPIFENLLNGNLICQDNLHKDHYEVFDSTGHHHLGEMDLDGNLHPEKADKTKHLD